MQHKFNILHCGGIRYAVVTGANKGIGLETVKQLASNGISVVLTARDEKRGHEAVEKLKEFGLSGQVVFHQYDALPVLLLWLISSKPSLVDLISW